MAWNLMKKRRDNLEKDKAEQPLLYLHTETKGFAPAGSDDSSLGVKAQQRGLDIRNAQKDSDDSTVSGPFPGGGKGKGTSSGVFEDWFGSGSKASAPEQAPTPSPTPTPTAQADYHEGEAKKYAPGNQSIPAQGTPNLSPEEKKALDDEINMKP